MRGNVLDSDHLTALLWANVEDATETLPQILIVGLGIPRHCIRVN